MSWNHTLDCNTYSWSWSEYSDYLDIKKNQQQGKCILNYYQTVCNHLSVYRYIVYELIVLNYVYIFLNTYMTACSKRLYYGPPPSVCHLHHHQPLCPYLHRSQDQPGHQFNIHNRQGVQALPNVHLCLNHVLYWRN